MADGPTESILTWNVANWVTVTLMALTAFFVLGLIQKWYQKRNS